MEGLTLGQPSNPNPSFQSGGVAGRVAQRLDWGLSKVSNLAARVGTFSPRSLCRLATQDLLPLRWRWDRLLLARVWLCENDSIDFVCRPEVPAD